MPMEFQFGTNWAALLEVRRRRRSVRRSAMEGLFAFFLESSFLGPARVRRASASGRAGTSGRRCALFAGSWLSGYFIIATNAFMQHPVGHARRRRRRAAARGFLGLPAEPVGARPVRAHDGRRGRDGVVRGGGRRRLLRAAAACTAITRARLPDDRRHRGPGVERAGRVPDRRSAGQAGRAASAGGAGGDGGPLRERPRGRHRADRPAERRASGGSTTRSSCQAC